jgi:hypothetical protein
MKLLVISVDFDLGLPDHIFSRRQIVNKEWTCNGSVHWACINWAATDVPLLLGFFSQMELCTRNETCANGHTIKAENRKFSSHSLSVWNCVQRNHKSWSASRNLESKNQRHPRKWFQYIQIMEARGGVMVEALSYKPEGRGFDSRWYHWKFSLT